MPLNKEIETDKVQVPVSLFTSFHFPSVVRWDGQVHYITILFIGEFFTLALTDGFPIESDWQQVSRTLLSILVDLNHAVVWMILICLISKFSTPGTNPLVFLPSASVTIGITVTFMFHSSFGVFFPVP